MYKLYYVKHLLHTSGSMYRGVTVSPYSVFIYSAVICYAYSCYGCIYFIYRKVMYKSCFQCKMHCKYVYVHLRLKNCAQRKFIRPKPKCCPYSYSIYTLICKVSDVVCILWWLSVAQCLASDVSVHTKSNLVGFDNVTVEFAFLELEECQGSLQGKD